MSLAQRPGQARHVPGRRGTTVKQYDISSAAADDVDVDHARPHLHPEAGSDTAGGGSVESPVMRIGKCAATVAPR